MKPPDRLDEVIKRPYQDPVRAIHGSRSDPALPSMVRGRRFELAFIRGRYWHNLDH
jgi:hypothetical protein